jgi:hypothetical protein
VRLVAAESFRNLNSDPEQLFPVILIPHYDLIFDGWHAVSEVIGSDVSRSFKRKPSGTYQVGKNQALEMGTRRPLRLS